MRCRIRKDPMKTPSAETEDVVTGILFREPSICCHTVLVSRNSREILPMLLSIFYMRDVFSSQEHACIQYRPAARRTVTTIVPEHRWSHRGWKPQHKQYRRIHLRSLAMNETDLASSSPEGGASDTLSKHAHTSHLSCRSPRASYICAHSRRNMPGHR